MKEVNVCFERSDEEEVVSKCRVINPADCLTSSCDGCFDIFDNRIDNKSLVIEQCQFCSGMNLLDPYHPKVNCMYDEW
jgi:hypothetical protein